jgi:predicted ATPase
VLATSRQRLGLAGEVVWHVPSLSAPEPGALPEEEAGAVACALTSPAVRLFVERAGAARPGFGLADRQNAAAVCTLCRRLDGIPLALELAAARVGALTPGQLASRLDDRFALLTQGARTALPRQKTLRALIDWSYELLTDEERFLLRRLSVFADGWTLEATGAICHGTAECRMQNAELSHSARSTPHAALDVIDLLTSLTDKSLVVSEEHAGGLRYRMLETIREYARERLRQAGEDEEARRRYMDWVVTFVESARGEILGPHPDAAQDRLEPELGNIRDALGWARTSASPPGMYLRLAAVLWPFWDMRGYVPEGRVHLLAALERPDLPDSPERAYALLGTVVLLIEQNIPPQATALAQESLERFRALGDVSGTAAALLLLGHIFLYRSDHAAARPLLTESLASCREAGWVQARGVVLVHLGLLAQLEGDTEQSRTLREEGGSLLDRGDDARTPAYCLNFMNILATPLYVDAGDRALLERSLPLARKTGKKRRVAAIVHALGLVAQWQGDTDFALACYREAAQMHRATGNEHALSEALQHLGNVCYRLGDYPSACPIYRESLELFRKLGYSADRAANNLGMTLYHLGELEQARGLHREALAGYGSRIEGIAWSLERLGVVEAFLDEPSTVAQILGAAASARQEFGVAMARWDQADWDRAVARVRAVLGELEFDRLFEAARADGWRLAVERILREP